MPKGKYEIKVKLSENTGGGLFDILANGKMIYQTLIPKEELLHTCSIRLDDNMPNVLEYRMLVGSPCRVCLNYIQVKEIQER